MSTIFSGISSVCDFNEYSAKYATNVQLGTGLLPLDVPFAQMSTDESFILMRQSLTEIITRENSAVPNAVRICVGIIESKGLGEEVS